MAETDEDIYRKLQKHLDSMPIGFPATENGAEIRVLKAFFTPEEAKFATFLRFFPETAKTIWRRIKKTMDLSLEETQAMLKSMDDKGLLLHDSDPESGETLYLNAPLAIGFYEFSINNLDKKKVEAIEGYFETFMKEFFLTGIPQMRTIPIDAAITPDMGVMAYDEVWNIFDQMKGPFAVAPCICVQEREILGRKCEHELTERCMTNSRWYIRHGHAREITKEEARSILKKAQEDGLVVQPGNFKRSDFFCLCCGCCCGILTNLKKLEKPAQLVATNHYSEVDPNNCTACATCMDRCPMDAITVEDVAVVNRDRCIGCGVCISTCPADAIHLRRKAQLIEPPENLMDMYKKIMTKKTELRKSGK
ncbi:MAG TPA: 4Fe-4S binding protein [Candidatus Deferrimicrobium sp.]|nr:4Fe-4S binding protein [Candidatus Deferrimicrobium sp.]